MAGWLSVESILAVGKKILDTLAKFWRSLVTWIKKAVNKIKEVLSRAPEGVQTFLAKIGGQVRDVSSYYVKDQATREWTEYTYTKPVSVNEVPAELQARAQRLKDDESISTTQELALALQGR